MGSLDNMALRRFKGGGIFYPFYKLFMCAFKLNNGSRAFIDNTECYKIHCFDKDDDIVDVYSSHHHEVAKNFSRVLYKTVDFKQFYESLIFVFEIERELFNHDLINDTEKDLDKIMIENIN